MCALLVDVPEFAGPLDLLLKLIQSRRLDVTAVSLAAVADQYLEQVLALEGELDALSEFLLLASQLLLIKSRALLPTVADVEPDGDPVEELRRRLAEYQVLQAAAAWLGERESGGWRSWARGGELPVAEGPVLLSPVAPAVLSRVLGEWLQRRAALEPKRSLPLTTRPTLRARAHYLLQRLTEGQWLPLGSLLGADVAEAVATFLAVLVLVRAGIVSARQPTPTSPPEVRRNVNVAAERLVGVVWE